MKKFREHRHDLEFNIISAIVLLLFVFGIVIGLVGMIGFTESFKQEYSTSTANMAQTATTLINGDSIDIYLSYLKDGPYKKGKDREYDESKRRLDIFCDKMNVSLLYVIKVDTSDYGSFVSVFNSVDNEVADTNYTPWELGYQRDTTNDEYREKYRAIYEDGSEYENVFRTKDRKGSIPHITTLVPVKDSEGNVVSILCVQRPIRELSDARRFYLFRVLLLTIIITIGASIIAVFYIRRQFVKPIGKVSAEATRFAKENTQGEKLGKLSRINEIADLASSIDTMEEDMLRYIDNLTAVTSEKERISAELSVASIIQENSIPNDFPAFPERDDFDIYASMTPAKEVGGDFYNFFLIDDDHLAFVIGDVSGKGVPAALFMMVTNIIVSINTRMGGSPGEILTAVNNSICARNKADMFVTLFLGVLDLKTGVLTAANAGHDDAAICHENGSFELYKTRHGLAVGAMPGIKYKDFEIRLQKGDKIFLYTDGVPEATDANVEMYTTARMLDALNEYKEGSPQEILSGVHESVNTFVGDAPQFDDLTMLCIEMKSGGNTKRLTVDATDASLPAVSEFTDGILSECDCSTKTQMQIRVAIEEIFVNIAHYAYDGATGSADVIFEINDDTLSITFRDSGKPYNPLEKADPDTTLSAEERNIGGLGIFMVKKLMDSVSYINRDGQNILTLTKRLQ